MSSQTSLMSPAFAVTPGYAPTIHDYQPRPDMKILGGDNNPLSRYNPENIELDTNVRNPNVGPLRMGDNFGNLHPALRGLRYHGVYSQDGVEYPIVSGLYHKWTPEGKLEESERLIVLTGIAFGWHPDHAHQPYGDFIVGVDIGRYTPKNNRSGKPERWEWSDAKYTEVGVKYFSSDCFDRRDTQPDRIPVEANPDARPDWARPAEPVQKRPTRASRFMGHLLSVLTNDN